ncbi:MAG: hypothetical protein ACE5DK_08640 [Paracoccaceae bacterium]
MSEAESFIEEVSEEVRRDKLFALMRKYGWIAILLVVLVVGGAAVNEWRKARAKAAAEALGDAVLAATEIEDATQRAAAIGAILPTDAAQRDFLALFEAASLTEAEDREGALAILDELAKSGETPVFFRDLARMKAVILRGADLDLDERLAILDDLATPGNPLRVVALEQKALAYYDSGNNDKAINVLKSILEEPDATQGLLQRAQQLIVALGGTLPETGATPGNDG